MRAWLLVLLLPALALAQAGPVTPSASSGGGGLTDAELRAADVKITLDGEIPHVVIDSMPAGGSGLTDSELRATPVGVSVIGNVTFANTTIAVTNAGTFAVQAAQSGTWTVTGAGGTFPVTGTFWQATQPISGTVSISQTTTANDVDVATLPSVTIGTFPDNEPFNVAQVGGAAVSTAASGIQKVGIVGNAGAAFDAANNAALPANVAIVGVETITTGTTPTAATTGNGRRLLATTEGVLFTREGSSFPFSCFVPITTTATTQCQAAPGAGLKAYITSVTLSNAAATVQGVDIVYGTGAACVTGTTAITHKFQMGTNATTTSPFVMEAQFPTPLVPAAANAICLRPTAATGFGATITGYIAP